MAFTLRDIIGAKAADALAPVSQCPTGKVAYLIKADADRALALIHRTQTKMRRFRCHYCERYHLGHRRGTD